MRFDVLTLFPEIFTGYLEQSLLKKAIEKSLVDVHLWNVRDWASDKHKSVDDTPYGGGPGMLIMWDNRSVLHRATGGYEGYRRLLHRITISERD